jgi:AraC family transcriptional regulator of adaptative response/methylated-DNA-[protein]-cysteine methyltransferase
MTTDYQRVEKIIQYLGENFKEQPSLTQLAEIIHLSPFHFQRLFRRWAGISPKKFLQFLTIDYAKSLLTEARNILDVSYETGLSGPSRLHDLFINTEAVTPGEYKNRGLGLRIAYALHDSPFGKCLLASTERGICALSFHDKADIKHGLQMLKKRWEKANIYEDESITKPIFNTIFSKTAGELETSINLLLRGTNFQLKVWEALLKIPPGAVCTYQDIADIISHPGATRAVGQAISKNPIAYLIPCHRVIRKVAEFGEYQWGTTRKKALIGWEIAKEYQKKAM